YQSRLRPCHILWRAARNIFPPASLLPDRSSCLLIELSWWFIALGLIPNMTPPRLGAEKEVRTFFQLDNRDKRFAFLERDAVFFMRGDCAPACPPPLVLTKLVGTDMREDHGGT